MMSKSIRAARATALAMTTFLAFVGATGCELKTNLDGKKLEKDIEDGIEDQTDLKVKSVDCPSTVVEEKGKTFECTVKTKEGDKVEVEVKMLGGGDVKWETVDPDKKKKKKKKDDDDEEDEDDDDSESELGFDVGDKVEVKWNGEWYEAKILKVRDDEAFITYDGYDESWDEWVGPERIRER